MEEIEVVLVGIVDDLFASLNELIANTEILVGSLKQSGRYFYLWESSMKHAGSLDQGKVGPLFECMLTSNEVKMFILKLGSLSSFNLFTFPQGLNAI